MRTQKRCQEATPTLQQRWQPISAILAVVLMATGMTDARADKTSARNDLADFSLEELLNTEITTLSRKPESLGSAPAAVHVISQSDIRRSGARSIPELLRLVPGMQVAQIDGNKWAVTSRGDNGRFANKLLVLMDGRTLYNPMMSGVQWDVQDTDVAAIERIEVIRGPGATMWGSNAVNGIVNIITKHAADTQGGNIGVLGGGQGHQSALRYGSKAGDSAFRGFVKYSDYDGNVDLLGEDSPDYTKMGRIGGRYDWDGTEANEVTLTAEAYSGESGEYRIDRTVTPPYEAVGPGVVDVSGGFIMADWSHEFESGSNLNVRTYFDTHEREEFSYSEDIDTLDIELQHSLSAGDIHELLWGASYRRSSDETESTFEIVISPPSVSRTRMSAFIQDEMRLMDGRARLMVGTKVEHNDFTDEDFEIEPSIRFSTAIGENQTIWASVSHAVRMPSRGEQGGSVVVSVLPPGDPQAPLPVPTAVVLVGNANMLSEEVTAYEMGYRMRNDTFQFDVAAFFNRFSDLRSLVQEVPVCRPSGTPLPLDPNCLFTASHVESPLRISNQREYDALGLEMWVSKQVTDSWRLQGAYSHFHLQHETASGLAMHGVVEDSPDHQASLRSSTDISDNLELDVWLRWTDDLEGQGIDAYTAMGFRLSWAPVPTISIAAVGRNLLAGDHVEFTSELADLAPVQIEPEGFLELRWRF